MINNIERIEAHVKWYNPEKGYGFLNQENGSSDIMIHFSTLDRIGCPYVKAGELVVCDVATGKAGRHVIRVIEVKLESLEPRSLANFFKSQLTPYDLESLEEIEGTLKWYNPTKGYGFILPDDGGQEIFLHESVIRATGYKFLEPGIRVLVKASTSERGQEARMLTLLCTEEEKERQEVI